MAKTFFSVSKWKRSPEIRRMLHPNADWHYEQKPPTLIYGRADDREEEIAVDVDLEGRE